MPDQEFQDAVIEHLKDKPGAYSSTFMHFVFEGIPFSDMTTIVKAGHPAGAQKEGGPAGPPI